MMIPPSASKVLILLILFASVVFADDFKTVNGKEYKNATVTGVEADGVMVKTKGGISKVYFAELPTDVQERFHYDPQKAAAAQVAAVRQTQELNQFNSQQEELAKQQKGANAKQYQQGLEQQAKYNNVQALTDQLSILQQQEQNLLVRVGQAEKAKLSLWPGTRCFAAPRWGAFICHSVIREMPKEVPPHNVLATLA